MSNKLELHTALSEIGWLIDDNGYLINDTNFGTCFRLTGSPVPVLELSVSGNIVFGNHGKGKMKIFLKDVDIIYNEITQSVEISYKGGREVFLYFNKFVKT